MKFFWHRVITVAAPGVTSEDATYGQIKTLYGSVLLNGLYGILRTRRGEATGRRSQRADEALIEPDGENEKFAQHRRSG